MKNREVENKENREDKQRKIRELRVKIENRRVRSEKACTIGYPLLSLSIAYSLAS